MKMTLIPNISLEQYKISNLYKEIKDIGIKIGHFPIIEKNKLGYKEITGCRINKTSYVYKGIQIYTTNNQYFIQNYKQSNSINPVSLNYNEIDILFYNGLKKAIIKLKLLAQN